MSDSRVGLDMRVLTPAFELIEDGIAVSGYAFNDVPGAPRLPVHGAVLELPASGRWELDFVSSGSHILDPRITVPAVPVPVANQAKMGPGDPLQNTTTVLTEDRPDPTIYGRDAYYPHSPVVAGAEQWQRGNACCPSVSFPSSTIPSRAS